MKVIQCIMGFILISLLFWAGSAKAGEQGSKYFTNSENVAIQGYDPVAYFTENKAVRGMQKYETEFDGVKFWFASAAHKEAFKKAPQKYLPQYGGWCAFAMGMKNTKVPSDPETFKLYNGKLYLFFNDYYQGTPFNTIVPWNQDEQNLKAKADAHWKTMTGK